MPAPRHQLHTRYRARGRHRASRNEFRVTAEVRRSILLAAAAVVCLTVLAVAAATGTPTAEQAKPAAADREPSAKKSISKGRAAKPSQSSSQSSQSSPSPSPRRTSPSHPSRTRQTAPPGKLVFGAEPLRYVQQAAAAAAGAASCAVSAAQATALTLAPTWPETAPSGEPPSPMTLSRYDLQRSLANPIGRAIGLFFHPGVGLWQLDSAGIGAPFTAGEAIDSKFAADRMAPYLVERYCGARKSGSSESGARATAWRDWYACGSGACERTYDTTMAGGVVPVEGIGRYGGGQPRKCEYQRKSYDCLFVDPAAAEGANWWAERRSGAAPKPVPFYVLRVTHPSGDREVRYWLAADSKAPVDVSASRPVRSNARGGLSWSAETTLCDRTTNRGHCSR